MRMHLAVSLIDTNMTSANGIAASTFPLIRCEAPSSSLETMAYQYLALDTTPTSKKYLFSQFLEKRFNLFPATVQNEFEVVFADNSRTKTLKTSARITFGNYSLDADLVFFHFIVILANVARPTYNTGLRSTHTHTCQPEMTKKTELVRLIFVGIPTVPGVSTT